MAALVPMRVPLAAPVPATPARLRLVLGMSTRRVRRDDGRVIVLHVTEGVPRDPLMYADGLAAPPSITCPRCGRTSRHPDDVREGYCGACHDWTSEPRR